MNHPPPSRRYLRGTHWRGRERSPPPSWIASALGPFVDEHSDGTAHTRRHAMPSSPPSCLPLRAYFPPRETTAGRVLPTNHSHVRYMVRTSHKVSREAITRGARDAQ